MFQLKQVIDATIWNSFTVQEFSTHNWPCSVILSWEIHAKGWSIICYSYSETISEAKSSIVLLQFACSTWIQSYLRARATGTRYSGFRFGTRVLIVHCRRVQQGAAPNEIWSNSVGQTQRTVPYRLEWRRRCLGARYRLQELASWPTAGPHLCRLASPSCPTDRARSMYTVLPASELQKTSVQFVSSLFPLFLCSWSCFVAFWYPVRNTNWNAPKEFVPPSHGHIVETLLSACFMFLCSF